MSDELTHPQLQFLKDYAQATRSISDIMKDWNITLDDLVTWTRKNKTFRRRLRSIDCGLALVREMQLRLGGFEAARLAWATLQRRERSFKTLWQMRVGKLSIDQARKVDQTLRGRRWRRPLKPDDLVDPIHPAYRAQAYRVLSDMQMLHEAAKKKHLAPSDHPDA
jgi:hypothetical protein